MRAAPVGEVAVYAETVSLCECVCVCVCVCMCVCVCVEVCVCGSGIPLYVHTLSTCVCGALHGRITPISPTIHQYENEACLFERWGTMGLTRPHWSDSKGKIKQPREAFEPVPPGWRWEGNWFIRPDELSMAFEPDEGLDEWAEDVFENQLRDPLCNWPPEEKSRWTDVVSLI